MNILQITNHLNIGGITSYVLTLAAGMKRRGHNVYVASSGGQLLLKFTREGIGFFPIPIRTKQELSPKIFMSMLKLFGFIARHDIDIVHTHTRTTHVLGALLGLFNRDIKQVTTCHGFFKPRLSRRIFPCWGKKVIAISRQVEEHLISDFKVKIKNIALINSGVDVEKFSRQRRDPDKSGKIKNPMPETEIRRKFGLKDAPVVGVIARLADVKGHTYLIEAMGEINKVFPDAQLFIVGDGKMKERLVGLARGLGISQGVIFHPGVPDTTEVLSVMDVFVIPSLDEGLGIALIEAMAAGRASIGSDVGGIKNLIKHNITGFLVRPADSKAIAGAVIELLRDDKKRESIGRAAQQFVSENFSQDRMILEVERVYLECLNAKY